MTDLRCGFNGCGRPNATVANVRGTRTPLCPMHLEELIKLEIVDTVDGVPSAGHSATLEQMRYRLR